MTHSMFNFHFHLRDSSYKANLYVSKIITTYYFRNSGVYPKVFS